MSTPTLRDEAFQRHDGLPGAAADVEDCRRASRLRHQPLRVGRVERDLELPLVVRE
jgi:hypothetical protein